MVTGTYVSGITVFRGQKDGLWAAGEKIKDAQGKVISMAPASVVAAADWDGDGDVDLVVGFLTAQFQFFPNESKNGTLSFGAPIPLNAAGAPVKASHAGPCLADWDKDGDLDLIVGADNGSVVLYRASHVDGSALPDLAAAETLVPALPTESNPPGGIPCDKNWKTSLGRSGPRAKTCVADWNADGKPDLIVGDNVSLKGPEPVLTAAQVQTRDALAAEETKLTTMTREAVVETDRAAREKLGIPAGQKVPEDRVAEYSKLRNSLFATPEINRANARLQEIRKSLDLVRVQTKVGGFVWVYLRK